MLCCSTAAYNGISSHQATSNEHNIVVVRLRYPVPVHAGRFLRNLGRLASQFGVAVVVTNQVWNIPTSFMWPDDSCTEYLVKAVPILHGMRRDILVNMHGPVYACVHRWSSQTWEAAVQCLLALQ